MSENLFDYATRELSQDDFLRWLLENYNDPIVGPAAIKLLQRWMELYLGQDFDVSKITKIKTYAQHKHIDLIADVTVDSNVYSFVIEDKTGSGEHGNQLIRYNKVIDSWKDSKYKYRVFYKTGYVDENELEQISKPGWSYLALKRFAILSKNSKTQKTTFLLIMLNTVTPNTSKLLLYLPSNPTNGVLKNGTHGSD